MDCYAVMGNPIHQSQSPNIHRAFAEQEAQSIQYDALEISTETGAFETAVKQFFSQGGRGLNVTVPFKADAWALAEIRSPAAEKAGAVNTLSYNSQLKKLLGDNTDGLGLVRDLTVNLATPMEQKRVLVLGAGGAVRGVLQPILQQLPSELVIANRTLTKAQELVEIFTTPELALQSSCFDALEKLAHFDVIINGTAASLHGELPPLPASIIGADTVCHDMMYGAKPTLFNVWAQEQGARHTYDGLGMLVEQAAESYYIWRGFHPQTAPVIQSIRQALNSQS